MTLEDGSILVLGMSESQDVFAIDCELDPTGINAIRLEAIADDRLPNGGPGMGRDGNFQLAEIELSVPNSSTPDGTRQYSFRDFYATLSIRAQKIPKAIDGNHDTAWNMVNEMEGPHGVIFYLEEPIPPGSGERLIVRLIHGGEGEGATIGRFRLSAQRADIKR